MTKDKLKTIVIACFLGLSLGVLASMLSGCEKPKPTPPKPQVANTNYEALMAWEISLSMGDLILPTPVPDDEKVKVGDKCPRCEGTGKLDGDHDGNPDSPCRYCGADGTVDEGDPILDSLHAIEILVETSTTPLEEFQHKLAAQFELLSQQVNGLYSFLQETDSPNEEVPPPDEEERVEEPEYREITVYTAVYKGRIYTWSERMKKFIDPNGNSISFNMDSTTPETATFIQICHGSFCEVIPIKKTTKKERVQNDGPDKSSEYKSHPSQIKTRLLGCN